MMLTFSFITFLFLTCASAAAQDIHIRALNGSTGKPLANQRLLIFQFHRMDDKHEFNMDLHTDAHGEAVLKAENVRGKFLQVWTDFMTDCVKGPNFSALDVAVVQASGLTRENTCSGKIKFDAAPHELIIFARKPTLREVWNW